MVRALVAVHGANLEALTGDDTFRIPLSRCSLESEGRKILARDQQSSLVIWSDDDGFLQTLERAQRGILKREVQRIRAAARRRRLLESCAAAVVAVGGVCAAAVPATRWAVAGGIPSIADRIGESAIERLALPTGVGGEADAALAIIAEQLRPATAPTTRSFRLLLADYSEAHSFGIPAGTIVVSAGLVCSAKDPESVAVVVARELAHLENHDVSKRVAEAVDFSVAFALVRGDLSALRARMLDFADRERCPGFPQEQQTAAEQRARAILTATAAVRLAGGIQRDFDWSKVRAEACELIGR
jgi:Zn-dependent protease with chaperone function